MHRVVNRVVGNDDLMLESVRDKPGTPRMAISDGEDVVTVRMYGLAARRGWTTFGVRDLSSSCTRSNSSRPTIAGTAPSMRTGGALLLVRFPQTSVPA